MLSRKDDQEALILLHNSTEQLIEMTGTDEGVLATHCSCFILAKVEITLLDKQKRSEFCIDLLRLAAGKDIVFQYSAILERINVNFCSYSD